ncbi:hypothetical protein [Metasolibacillus sp. FSL K6-0083]|uniref:hypothetical protein n=1 Tax=Metasolibacillus sp. FSL K6-0083 TaxID=2921416 RepID=UPI003159E4C8
MIHTFKMYVPIHHSEVQNIQRRFGITYNTVSEYFEGAYPGVSIVIINAGSGDWRLSFVVDAIKLLEKSNITEADYPMLEQELKEIMFQILGHSAYYKEHILTRIDYRYDVVMANAAERHLLIALYRKLTRSHRHQKRYLGIAKKGEKFNAYETTVYHSSKSTQAVVYLKDEEREAKGIEPEEHEKNVVRYEARVLNGHLNYMSKETTQNNRPKKLWAYLKEDIFIEYFTKYFSSIYHPCDFYKLDESRSIIRQSALSSSNKEKLINFLKSVSSFDLDTPLKTMTKSTRKRRLELLKELGINPVSIPKNYPNAPSAMKNPLDKFPWKMNAK